jgi:ATP-binding cassette subfamily B protein
VLTDAPVLLLDEATSALDETTEKKLLSNIRELKEKTCIIISHKTAAYEICNKELVIKDKNIEINNL